MSFCVAPGCQHPLNGHGQEYCNSCGAKLRLGGRYLPIQLIGQGGFGKTFLAIDQQIPSLPQCVVKQLYIDNLKEEIISKATGLFHQESQRLDELGNHPQIPHLLAHFKQSQQFYLVQEFICGQTLDQLFIQEGEFSEVRIRQLLTSLLPVLQFIHDKNIIHRDIKPANIIIRTTDQLPTLIDFGVAKVLVSRSTSQTGTIVGTPDYMPPEQAYGKVFPASDLYGLGATCLYLLTGERPGEMFDVLEEEWLWRRYLPAGRGVSDRLGKILNKLIAPKLSQRYQSALEVITDLQTSSPVTRNGEVSPPIASSASSASSTSSNKLSDKPPIESPINSLKQVFIQNPLTANTEIISQIPAPVPNSLTSNIANIEENIKKNIDSSCLALNLSSQNPILSKGLNYSKLQVLLLRKKWQEADVETWDLLRQASGKVHGIYLDLGDIERIPAEDLYKIDELWSNYSKKKFGFTIQSLIYEDGESDYQNFCQAIGWLSYLSSVVNDGYVFTDKAPRGHLPSRRFIGGFQWWRHAEIMAKKLRRGYE